MSGFSPGRLLDPSEIPEWLPPPIRLGNQVRPFPTEMIRLGHRCLYLDDDLAHEPYVLALGPAGLVRLLQDLCELSRRRYPEVSLRTMWASIRERVAPRVFDRDGHWCRACGSGERLSVDHIIPLARGGSVDDPSNLQTLCISCNSSKGAR